MVDFNVSVTGLNLRVLGEQDLQALNCHVGDLKTFDYVSNSNPAVRRHGARAATGSAVAHALMSRSVALNDQAMTVWLKRWLRDNSEQIRNRLSEDDAEVFLVLANWLEGEGAHSTILTGRGIHLVGTVPDLASIGQVLTQQKLYGPQSLPTPHNERHALRSAYLIGTRAGAGSRAATSAIRPLWAENQDASFLKRYGL